MKKQILTIGVAMLFTLGSATFIGCGNDEHHDEEHHEHTEGEGHHEHEDEHHEEVAETAYFCPMKCEGEKTYEEEGSCPTCGMDLVE